MQYNLKYFTTLLICLATSFCWAQDITFKAKVSKKKLGINERLRVDFEMNNDGDNFTPPGFEGFTIVGGPNQSVSRQYINGKGTFSKTYSYFLAPKKRGKFKIGQAQITFNNEIYKSVPVTVEVTAAVKRPNDPNDAVAIAERNIHVVAELSKTKPYLNEAITVTYKLYVSEDASVSNWRELDAPDFSDFWSQNINEKEFQVREGTFNNEPYRYVILRRVVLYPQKTGKITLEPLALDVTIDVPTNRRDLFGRILQRRQNITLASKSRVINVKPLPEEGKPADFNGAVGRFNFNITTNKKNLDATEALELTVKASGSGNLKLFKLPEPTLPKNLEVYTPENQDKVRTNAAGMSGFKQNKYTVVPQYKGKYPIPPVTFSYFDPKIEKYKQLTSDEIVIDVQNGPQNQTQQEPASTSKKSTKQNVIANSNQFMFIKQKTTFKSINETPFFKSNLFWGLLIAPLLLIPIARIIKSKRSARKADVSGNRIRKADKLARKFLSEAKKNMGNKKEFYIALERALHNYLKAKLNIQTSDLSKTRITNLLKQKEVNASDVTEYIGLLESCEFARYTPSSKATMQQDFDKAVRTISTLDKQF